MEISKLPNEILLMIIEMLGINDAVSLCEALNGRIFIQKRRFCQKKHNALYKEEAIINAAYREPPEILKLLLADPRF